MFLVILDPFWSKVTFFKKNGLCQFKDFTIAYHYTKNHTKWMRGSWGKLRTDGRQTFQSFSITFCLWGFQKPLEFDIMCKTGIFHVKFEEATSATYDLPFVGYTWAFSPNLKSNLTQKKVAWWVKTCDWIRRLLV